MLNLSAVLDAAGSSLDNILKVNIYLTNLEDFAEVNNAYTAFFPGLKPASTSWPTADEISNSDRLGYRRGLALESPSFLWGLTLRLSAPRLRDHPHMATCSYLGQNKYR
jgi:hypothetical protein